MAPNGTTAAGSPPHDVPARVVAKVILVAVAIGTGIYALYLVRNIVILLLVSVFLATALAPAVNALDRGRFPRWAAILAVYFGIVLSIFGVGLLVVPPVVNGINDLTTNLPTYVEDLRKNDTLRRYDEKYDIVNKLQKEADKVPQRLGDAVGTLRDVTVGVFTRIVQLVTVLVITFMLLLDGGRILEFMFRQLPPDQEERARGVTAEVQRAISGYVIGNLLISVVAGLVAYATLTLLDVPFAVPLAVLMAFLDLIPLVGATLGGVILGIVCAIVDFPTAVIVWVVVLIVYQQVENNLLQPVIYSRTVQLHPVIVLIAVLIGGSLLGVLGVLLAIPAAAAMQIVVKDWWAHRDKGLEVAAASPPQSL
jgi:predicted PurR-regulated permease PerM